MELQDFIKNTLVQITNGIVEAQKELLEIGCVVNPEGIILNETRVHGHEKRNIQLINMHVVLDVSSESGTKTGIGIAKVIKAGIDSGSSESRSEVTTVQFKIPVAFPVIPIK